MIYIARYPKQSLFTPPTFEQAAETRIDDFYATHVSTNVQDNDPDCGYRKVLKETLRLAGYDNIVPYWRVGYDYYYADSTVFGVGYVSCAGNGRVLVAGWDGDYIGISGRRHGLGWATEELKNLEPTHVYRYDTMAPESHVWDVGIYVDGLTRGDGRC